MKIPFNIEYRPQVESGEYKVVTRDNLPARIICWDAEGLHIVALVKEGEETEIPYSYLDNGTICFGEAHNEDLFVIAPEPELTPFEHRLAELMQYTTVEIENNQHNEINDIKEAAKELLSLVEIKKYNATKVDEQLIEKMVNDKFKQFDMVVNPENTKHFYKQGLCDMYKQFAEELDEAFKHQDEVVFNEGYDKGQADALKDLPKWEQTEGSFYLEAKITLTNRLCYNEYSIPIDELLEKLPKRNRTIDGKLVDE